VYYSLDYLVAHTQVGLPWTGIINPGPVLDNLELLLIILDIVLTVVTRIPCIETQPLSHCSPLIVVVIVLGPWIPNCMCNLVMYL